MKRTCVFTLLLTVSVCLTAQVQPVGGKGFSLSLAPSLGLLNGVAEEIVYYKKGSKGKLSQLLWNMNPLVYAGVDINFDWRRPGNRLGLFVGSSFKRGIPMETGIMEDRDWTGYNSNGVWLSDFLTHYSVHDNNTDNALLIDADFGLSFKVSETYSLRAYMTYDYMTFLWTARGGSLLYPAEDTDKDGDLDQRHYYLPNSRQAVGTYKQTWHIVSPGIAFYGKFNRFFDIDISLKISPLVWLDTVDEHLLRDLTIEDSMSFGFFIEPMIVFSFTPRGNVALSLAVSYTNMSGLRGDSVYKQQGEQTIKHQDVGGAGYRVFDIGLTVRYKVLW
ncbi:MAG: omptin family outer membrane protease [Spirochaetaceae bacterium]|jgi:outer membrane protease|nr:omptin family outer membrane protease [Spirochaetaceae bacterium]